MTFETQLDRWIKEHLEQSQGERRRRLKEGPGHAEKAFLRNVWWPAFGSFSHLHPEYEVFDMAGKSRFLDFAYISGALRVALEIEGFGPHWRNIDRWKFADDLRRYNQLIIDGWLPLRFSYDDITDHPRLCEQTIRTLLGRWMGTSTNDLLSARERDLLRWAIRHGSDFTPAEAAAGLGVTPRHARELLHHLASLGYLQPSSGQLRVRTYRLNRQKPVSF